MDYINNLLGETKTVGFTILFPELMSHWMNSSDVTRINQSAGKEWVKDMDYVKGLRAWIVSSWTKKERSSSHPA